MTFLLLRWHIRLLLRWHNIYRAFKWSGKGERMEGKWVFIGIKEKGRRRKERKRMNNSLWKNRWSTDIYTAQYKCLSKKHFVFCCWFVDGNLIFDEIGHQMQRFYCIFETQLNFIRYRIMDSTSLQKYCRFTLILKIFFILKFKKYYF